MLMLYFSATGNSKFIAELFSRQMNAKCHSIEEDVNFEELIMSSEIIGFCYPIYASRIPRNLREFTAKYTESLKGKKAIIFCTQMVFSGDGARAFTDLLPRKAIEVIYAEHFNMPNNIPNVFLTPLARDEKVLKYFIKAEQKMQTVCRDIKAGIVKKRGFNVFSRMLGLPQAAVFPLLEWMARKSVKVNQDCNQCELCVSICPVSNLHNEDGRITHKKNCIACYRCVNQCPKKAITVVLHGKVKKQYSRCKYSADDKSM
jgi:Fe-S-cluster-containing hydrogenase component 2